MDKYRRLKKWSLAAQYFMIIVIVCFVISIFVNFYRARPYKLSSKGVQTLAEKVQIIKPHFKLPSKIEDIEYYCDVRPSAIIGPSRYSDVIAVKVAASDIDTWLGNYSYNSAYDGEKLLSNIEKSGDKLLKKAIWRHSSRPKVYVNGTKEIIVFQAEGILIIKQSK